MSRSATRQKIFKTRAFGLSHSLIIALIVLCGFIAPGCNTADNTSLNLPIAGKISAETALNLLTEHETNLELLVIDVRTPGEFAPEHLKNAINIDFNAPHFEETIAGQNKGNTYLVYCGSGSRSGEAAELMRQLGFARVYDLEGGLIAMKQLVDAGLYLESCGCD
ncbi:MAG: rhodanese-like domain-containing protein [bacterium]